MMKADANEASSSSGAKPKHIKLVSVPRADIVDGTVFYIINVKPSRGDVWATTKRFSQFEDLHKAMTSQHGRDMPNNLDLPPKKVKLFVSHITKGFIEERRVLLQAYLRRLISIKPCASAEALFRWLSADKVPVQDDEAKSMAAGGKRVDLPDDVEVTGVSVPSTRAMSDHVLYQVDVVNVHKRKTFSKWTVLKRFQQFHEMDKAVRAAFINNPEVIERMPAPPQRKAKVLMDHMDDTFVEQRRVLLADYLQKMMNIIPIVRNETFLAFLGVQL